MFSGSGCNWEKKYRIVFSRKKYPKSKNNFLFSKCSCTWKCAKMPTILWNNIHPSYTINVISYNQYLCVIGIWKKKFAPEEKKNNRKTSKYVKQNKYYIKNVCVCRFCHTVSTLLYYYYYCFPPKIFGNAKFVNKKKLL